MNDQKVLEKARAYRLAYQAWFEAITDKSNPEEAAKLTAEMMLANNELSKAVTEEAWVEPPMEYPKYEVGEPVIYVNGTKAELGIVKKDCGDDEYFVNYHTGDTAARTHARHLVKVSNRYAYHIVRLDPDGNERKKIVGTTTMDEALEKTLLDNCPEVKKKLKALEIIKEKEVNVSHFKSCLSVGWDYALFERYCGDNDPYGENPPYQHPMTQDEFLSLKEALK